MRKFIKVVFEKYGVIKLFGSAILGVLFLWLFSISGIIIFKGLAIGFGVLVGIFFILSFVFAYIINPIRAHKKKTK